MDEIRMSNPETPHHPGGPYCQVSRVKPSEFVFIVGQTATDIDGNLVGAGDFEAQRKQVFANIEAALRFVGASWTNAVHFINSESIARISQGSSNFAGISFLRSSPMVYPPNTILFVDKLLHKEFLVEVQAIAAPTHLFILFFMAQTPQCCGSHSRDNSRVGANKSAATAAAARARELGHASASRMIRMQVPLV
jgi:enamine deaminase RidA (YjgF/YER057c/UK114 family)